MRSIKKFKIFESDEVNAKYADRLKKMQTEIDKLYRENEDLKKKLDKEIKKNK
jgi:membrane protein insertase Oxa1/YidC/SpoIIIJ